MDIHFCHTRELHDDELNKIAEILHSPKPTLECWFSAIEDGDDCNLIEYSIKDCPGMADVNMNEKMNRIKSALIVASEELVVGDFLPTWIRIHYGPHKKTLTWLSSHPNEYLSEKRLDKYLG